MPTITYNIPADKVDDVIAALRWEFTMPNATPAQLNAELESRVKDRIRDAVASHKRFLASQASEDINLD